MNKVNKIVSEDINDSNTAQQKIRCAQTKATIIALLLHISNPHYTWDFASVISVAMRYYSTSRYIQDLLSCIIPCSCSGKTAELRLVKAAKFIKDRKTSNSNQGSQTIRVYDNAPTRNIWKPTKAVN